MSMWGDLDEQKYVARMVTDHIADRIHTVEEQHHIRIRRWLRGTFTAMVLITVAMIACVAVVAFVIVFIMAAVRVVRRF